LRDENDERRSFHIADTNVSSPALIESSELDREGLREERRLSVRPELAVEKNERRSSIEPQSMNSSPASTDNSGRRSFPELEIRDKYMRGERQAFPTTGFQRANILSLTLTDSPERRSFPELELPEPEAIDSDHVFSMAMVQSTPSGDSAERRSFPALQLLGTELSNGRRSFPAPELQLPDISEYIAAVTQSSLNDGEAAARCDQKPLFVFEECNNMTKKKRSNFNMEGYLKEREGWTMMVLRHNVLKTVRFEHIADHMQRLHQEAAERKYFLVARYYAAHFRTKHINSLKSI